MASDLDVNLLGIEAPVLYTDKHITVWASAHAAMSPAVLAVGQQQTCMT